MVDGSKCCVICYFTCKHLPNTYTLALTPIYGMAGEEKNEPKTSHNIRICFKINAMALDRRPNVDSICSFIDFIVQSNCFTRRTFGNGAWFSVKCKHYTQAFDNEHSWNYVWHRVQNHMELVSLATAFRKINRFQSVCFVRTISTSINVLYFMRTITRAANGYGQLLPDKIEN